MSERPDVPRFGALLRDHIGAVPDAARPAFLAGLERSAAERYRRWAVEVPEHADALLGCAAREDEIADLVAGLFPVSPELQAQIDAHLPAAVAVYYDVFSPHSTVDQLYLQSEAELQGAQAWVSLAAGLPDGTSPQVAATLARCTELEEESSHVVKDLLAVLDAASRAS